MTVATTPAVARSRSDLDALVAPRRGRGPVVFVPTMGALHEGHATLLRIARERAGAEGTVVLSIFVNPLQFGAGEDLDRYPRTFDADLDMAGQEGVDVVFAPVVAEMYPDGVPHEGVASEAVTVQPGPLADRFEGASRPGHFRGVLTVVAKLFGLVRPDVAVFGEKDYQQLALIRRMVADLCLGIEIVGGATDREPDGLARSSRNRYLDAEQRQVAAVLSRALRAGQDRAEYGVPAARWAAMGVLKAEPGIELDYLALTTTGLGELPDYPESGTEGRILVAARVGTTRLIDNMPLHF
ncbi:pantoate--beta-alanine ligase [Nocardioides aromaticivorans]|uniref:Pantothenate synthetase n=1 Tax=Nocardioides aromaticivorans TaxID=200618 RepID=A0A7Y9ZIH0_9ACTN|nr:pantoate--beta-alanine ligase [Nocardioides aromaticivorans]NYI45485.1 pantoate--beta-alanine ligase [Nocardioides aromaticivorans]QSR24587.1 pantoate--beta-alanine ligase [Nocardioides aromaticivorans]